MIGFDYAIQLKIITGTPPEQAVREVMAAYEDVERFRAELARELAQAQRRDRRTLLVTLSCLVGLWVLVVLGLSLLSP